MSETVTAETGRRTVLVTGGSSGIGRAVIDAFRADGWATVCLSLERSEIATVDVTGDVCDPDAHRAAVDAAIAATGRLDVLVANAGIHDGGCGLEGEPSELAERVRRVLDVNVTGYVLAAQAAADALRAVRGDIVLTLSDASFLAGQQGAGLAYTASKHAGLGVLGWLARELAPAVRVNAIAPGGIVTDLRAFRPAGADSAAGADAPDTRVFADPDAKRRAIAEHNPLGVVLTTEEIAAYYRWIVSADAPGLTGQVIRPDGGLVVRS